MTFLFGLAPEGVCLATTLSNSTGGLLHHRFTITLSGCLFSVALSLEFLPAAVSCPLFYGVRTFLKMTLAIISYPCINSSILLDGDNIVPPRLPLRRRLQQQILKPMAKKLTVGHGQTFAWSQQIVHGQSLFLNFLLLLK